MVEIDTSELKLSDVLFAKACSSFRCFGVIAAIEDRRVDLWIVIVKSPAAAAISKYHKLYYGGNISVL